MAWAGAILVLTTGVRLDDHRSDHGFVVFVRWWIWTSQCMYELLLEVVDDNVIEIVDVLLIRINSWEIHLLHEVATIWLVGVLRKSRLC